MSNYAFLGGRLIINESIGPLKSCRVSDFPRKLHKLLNRDTFIRQPQIFILISFYINRLF